jgi:hypothetical protein
MEVLTINTLSSDPPSPYDGLKIASQLLLADGGKTATKPIRTGESNDPGMRQAMLMFVLPRWVKRVYAWYLRHIRKDEIYAGLVENWYEKTVEEYLALIARREEYRALWFEMWKEERLDFVLTVPNALPAVPHGGMKQGFRCCGYTFLFNLVSSSACMSFTTCIPMHGPFASSITPLVFCQSLMLIALWMHCHQSLKLQTPSRPGLIQCTMQILCMAFLLVYKLWVSDFRRRKYSRE